MFTFLQYNSSFYDNIEGKEKFTVSDSWFHESRGQGRTGLDIWCLNLETIDVVRKKQI